MSRRAARARSLDPVWAAEGSAPTHPRGPSTAEASAPAPSVVTTAAFFRQAVTTAAAGLGCASGSPARTPPRAPAGQGAAPGPGWVATPAPRAETARAEAATAQTLEALVAPSVRAGSRRPTAEARAAAAPGVA